MPMSLAFPERRRARQRQQVRQEVRELVHQVDAQLVVVDADVHVHAADHHAARGGLHFARHGGVVVLVRGLLRLGARRRDAWRPRSARCRSRRLTSHDLAAQARQLARASIHRAAHARSSPRSASAGIPGLICPPPRSVHSFRSSAGGSASRSRVARSTSRYSSSMPTVNGGSAVPASACHPSEVVVSSRRKSSMGNGRAMK